MASGNTWEGDLSRATGGYETAREGSVVLVSATTVGGDSEIPGTTQVVVDHPERHEHGHHCQRYHGVGRRLGARTPLVETQRPV